MPIRPLVEIAINHPFFATGRFVGAVILPDEATAARLRGLRIIAKARPGGLQLYVDLGDDGKPRLAIPEKTALRFDLMRPSADIAAATDLSAIGANAVFTDAGVAADQPLKVIQRPARASEALAKAAGTQTLSLAGRPLATATPADFTVLAPAAGVAVSGYDAASNLISLTGPAAAVTVDYPVKPIVRPSVLAPIEISIGADTVTQAAAGEPRRVVVALKAAAARWVYHLVTDLPNPIAEWRIQAGNGGGPAVTFNDAGRAELVPGSTEDPFGTDLARLSAPLRVLRFLSDAPVPASEVAARRIALFAGQHQLVPALPNPSPATLRTIGGKPAFGAVIRFVTT
ncbi:MAG: hypothetical protein AB7F74_17300 [Parvibaculaceae bacterium]